LKGFKITYINVNETCLEIDFRQGSTADISFSDNVFD